ncbi:substrate-binding domain-containing protein [Lacrimispora sp.]|uniref:substrate-binding domain-containing protein n=1 Tax=Lacrimispora sp. TaxID=2719234 RepID=UPI002FD8B449
MYILIKRHSETCPSAKFVADSEEGYALADNWSATEAQNIVENWISSGLINDMNVIACMNDALADAAITALGDDYPDMIVLGVDGKMIGRKNIQNGKMKATTAQNNTLFIKKMLDTCVDLANGAEIKFDDPKNKILDPLNITLLTVDTLSAPK